jgi:hypothetical protein
MSVAAGHGAVRIDFAQELTSHSLAESGGGSQFSAGGKIGLITAIIILILSLVALTVFWSIDQKTRKEEKRELLKKDCRHPNQRSVAATAKASVTSCGSVFDQEPGVRSGSNRFVLEFSPSFNPDRDRNKAEMEVASSRPPSTLYLEEPEFMHIRANSSYERCNQPNPR